MKQYLEKRIGEKLGVTRLGMPKEVYFEAVLKEVSGEVALFEIEKDNEIVLPIDKIVMIGPPEKADDGGGKKAGFL